MRLPPDAAAALTGSEAADTGPVSKPMVLWTGLVAVVSVLAFLLMDPIVAAFLVILLVTGLVIGFLARNWDQHPSYEERELARSRRRAAKWDRNKDKRAKDRARWEAHQARLARRADR
jgi:anaerobic C4-dicarboxylate transporter